MHNHPPQKPFGLSQNEDHGFDVIDSNGRVVLSDSFAYHDNSKAEEAWMQSVVDALNQPVAMPDHWRESADGANRV